MCISWTSINRLHVCKHFTLCNLHECQDLATLAHVCKTPLWPTPLPFLPRRLLVASRMKWLRPWVTRTPPSRQKLCCFWVDAFSSAPLPCCQSLCWRLSAHWLCRLVGGNGERGRVSEKRNGKRGEEGRLFPITITDSMSSVTNSCWCSTIEPSLPLFSLPETGRHQSSGAWGWLWGAGDSAEGGGRTAT